MLPWSPDFSWSAGNVIFLGAFYMAVLVISGTLLVAALRALRDLRGPRAEAILWHADFEDLPASARRCRHELTGEAKGRSCPNAFDCRSCATHAELLAARTPAFESWVSKPAGGDSGPDDSLFGFRMPLDRMYHRGHAWLRREDDGTATVGLDDLATRLLGVPDRIDLPAVGTLLAANGPAIGARKGRTDVRILSPVDGRVVETGAPGSGWLLRLAPPEGGFDTRHLLSGAEVRLWVLREVERLERVLSAEGTGPALADGGTPVEDLSRAIPPDQWDRAFGAMFLEP